MANWIEKNGSIVMDPISVEIADNVTVNQDLTVGGDLIVGATTLTDTDLAKIDGITNGTGAVNKALVLDANGDLTFVSSRTLTATSCTITGLSSINTGKTNLRSDLSAGSTGGNQGSAHRIIKRSAANINNNSATTVLTVTVPNANQAAAIKLQFVATLGSTDAFESTRYAEGCVVVARTSGADTVASALAISDATIATVSGGATLTLAYSVTGMTGTSAQTQTFNIQVTIVASGATGSNTCITVADVINETSSGVTVA